MAKKELKIEKAVDNFSKIAENKIKKGLPLDNITLEQIKGIEDLVEKLKQEAIHIKVFKND